MKAILRGYRQSPRKVRLVADAIRGRRVSEALLLLDHFEKRAAHMIKKVLDSAFANAQLKGRVAPTDLLVKQVSVDKGRTLYRHMPRARGRGAPIRKRTSHLRIELTEV
jgi:large subunit ribosomal protein L22